MTADPTPTMPKRALYTFIVLWALTAAYIALFPTRHYTADAVNNLMYIEQRDWYELFHPQHLLALSPGFGLHLALAIFRVDLPAWIAMRIAHAVLAGAAVALLYAALWTLTRSQKIAIGGALVLWLSYGFWHFSSDPDIYSLGYAAVALLMFAYVYYLRAPSTRRLAFLSFAAVFAILSHQLNLELGGLIGLSLIWLAWRHTIAWRHVVVYAAVCAVLIPLAYFAGYWAISFYFGDSGQPLPTFFAWAFRYFGAAQSGAATWGVTANASTIPTAVYTLAQSWVLPPERFPTLVVVLALVGFALLVVHSLFVLRRMNATDRLIALVCIGTLVANGISGWWWQVGNIKFYLFMQINLIVLVALYAAQPLPAMETLIRRLALGLLIGGLALIHVGFTLPYETRGGVFDVAALYGNDEAVALYFEDETQRRLISYLTPRAGDTLSPEDCQHRPDYRPGRRRIWMIDSAKVANCPSLEGATYVGSYQADRSYTRWDIYDVTDVAGQ
jgi:hypothetical protein